MEFGIAMATDAESWKLAQRAEELGFRSAWFYDTQMLSADCFVAMGAAAVKTSRIRLGTGVLIPSNRIAPVTANAFASLNKLAPGRIDMGIGTGFTGRRAMGLGAMKLKEFEEYIRVMLALLDEQTVEAELEGQRRKIRLLNPDLGLIDTRTPMRLHLAAAGPRARALTARLGAGWINFFSDVPAAVAMLGEMQQAWTAAGQAAGDLQATAYVLGCVLEEGEPADSDRAVAQAGPRAAVLLHRAADEVLSGLPNISPVPESCRAAVEGYVALARTFEPKDAPWLQNHRGHLMFVKPEERPFVTAEMVRISSFTATEAELKRRIGDLRDAGYTEFTVQIVPGQEAAIEDWARIMRAFR
ncbi:LLM class flavin-dependent oxidoreductase [Belnapia sp. T6]|uniref:LLM class flavin-dependent oxidoreductase n=1 Tax=Belnapia mucosa TaxID=2804532 RepID=A0ABS1V0V0_9PROT|nr:LLM class flavin-dependent oxidoreductase [Belnapia mucosa]MBL6455321.1 LLM class flavin-dependent oxidoreductase [Belnapia mucosa]